ncbi:putative ABC transporter ATP-binding protein YxlF [Gemmata obscuriglobus]|uniref:ABC transporter ATP-binding protein n=1 Tax=Gemmata obscuriglobus TaxID=114 RepID=A0A2Z3HHJ3_9BACT|nr:ABC transporter ATP-binding protein [Gemmata obscuriglobus]AWM40900.1 ABC transporter ATP-binding protein [Gemmata obscuriglobus]QEG25800.1 putative ABC transporter ATP-binding protein YxlF [Gemmata obscuriglobus]VTR99679.1 abc transporter atp-binding protein : ABC transporter related protein OS=Isosphaera pallida (strain ATCC 43644 / DSM 9630 / IS1B) GN=Isop_0119 PE=4 SV=1: ABC_tran [Gemmata obscuriglobus UQM 2246]
MTAAAVFDQVVKTYPTGLLRRGGVPALRGVSLTVPAGQVFGLLGPNRAGKTTLIKLLLSLCRPTSGAVTRLGAPLADRGTLGRVGYMHENHAFPRYLSASELLRFYGGLSGAPAGALGGRVAALVERVGLADRQAEPIARFSKGMVQRLGLAQALLNDPDLLILDEPTEGLDLFGRQLLRAVVRERRAAGKTVLLVSHVLTEVQELCDSAAVLVAGRVAFTGTLAELLRDPESGAARTLEAALQRLYQPEAA